MSGKPPVWLNKFDILAIHDRLLLDHGGMPGLRDEGLLDSALARGQQLFAYERPDLFDLAAAYAAGLTRNHPFNDGNKRVAFMALPRFLRLFDEEKSRLFVKDSMNRFKKSRSLRSRTRARES